MTFATAASGAPSNRAPRRERGIASRLFTASLLGCALAGVSHTAHAQARPTATRSGDLQVGGGYSIANPDYSPNRFKGYAIFASYDFFHHFGVGIDFHQVKISAPAGSNPNFNDLYERTYEVGARYVFNIRRVHPYAKFNVGRGVFNFPRNTGPANLAYNMYALGGGLDVQVIRHVNVRADYEFQRWPSFPPSGLQPNVVTIGAAYHF